MKKISLFAMLLLLIMCNVYAEEIPFPPELHWWLSEINKVNDEVEIEDFVFLSQRTKLFDDYFAANSALLKYPVFYRWNYSGNVLAYFNYHSGILHKQPNGKYFVSDFDDGGTLFIANKNKEIFFSDFFGLMAGIDSYHWLTDSVLIAVGTSSYDMDNNVDLFIKIYSINNNENSIDIKTYHYENALIFEEGDEFNLNLKWYEQRPDYFDLKE
jgi:hypothetical protein